MGVPTDRKYLKSHEWHKVEGDLCVIGITQFAADELTDITFVELPSVGKEVSAGGAFGQVESVKSTSDLMCGVSGVVAEANNKLSDAPELINNDPFSGGWIIKVKMSDPSQLDKLMDGAAYDAQIGG
ncbi:MAG TPA: glycine cleavage system protein GcvH [Phycisphaerae bacterium]|nr:glycine cleavage system protein GcvH [Phycisphaerae bacterium]HRW55171.1 glycine cleavage system protein GcvH [Phycisphaerae bacterium]